MWSEIVILLLFLQNRKLLEQWIYRIGRLNLPLNVSMKACSHQEWNGWDIRLCRDYPCLSLNVSHSNAKSVVGRFGVGEETGSRPDGQSTLMVVVGLYEDLVVQAIIGEIHAVNHLNHSYWQFHNFLLHTDNPSPLTSPHFRLWPQARLSSCLIAV